MSKIKYNRIKYLIRENTHKNIDVTSSPKNNCYKKW